MRWLLIVMLALALPFALAKALTASADDDPAIGQRDFERGLRTGAPRAGDGPLSYLLVLPPQAGRYRVMALRVTQSATTGETRRQIVTYTADTPYVAEQWRGGTQSFPTVVQYLRPQLAGRAGKHWMYAWWDEPWVWEAWLAATALVAARVLIPRLLTYLADRSRLAGAGKGGAAIGRDTAKDEAALNDAIRAMEATLGGDTSEPAAGGEADAIGRSKEVLRPLGGGVVEPAIPQGQGSEAVEYSGEFYPVQHGHAHPPGEPHVQGHPPKPGGDASP